MIRHISIFFFKENTAENEKEKVKDALVRLKEELSDIADYQVGINCAKLPPPEIKDAPEFGELVQVIDFDSDGAAMDYSRHPAHRRLVAEASISSVQFLMTCPSIFVVVMSLLSTWLCNFIPRKKLVTTGLCLVCCSGIFSVLFHESLVILYVWAAVLGIGIGMVVPTAFVLISEYFTVYSV